MSNRLSPDQRRLLLQRMLSMRRFDETVQDILEDQGFKGRSLSSVGNEAPAAAFSLVKRPIDLVSSTHRNHGHMIAMGIDEARGFAEVLGRKDGLNGGKGGRLHLCDRSKGFLSTSAMIGGANAITTGAAYSQKVKKNGGVAVSFLGDGSLDEGITYECLNLASLFSLPAVFLCENNAKAGERPSSMLAAKALADVPKALSLHTVTVDGSDAEAIHDALDGNLHRVREGHGPLFVECRIDRWPGMRNEAARAHLRHTDISLAWDRGKLTGPFADWQRNADPVLKQAHRLIVEEVMTADEVKALDRSTSERMASARKAAEASPFPAVESALDHVFE
jgi:TPP-dependent pyruvate/acetoin dehydrogenase alpha subunit